VGGGEAAQGLGGEQDGSGGDEQAAGDSGGGDEVEAGGKLAGELGGGGQAERADQRPAGGAQHVHRGQGGDAAGNCIAWPKPGTRRRQLSSNC
jgi:hypothetical protein